MAFLEELEKKIFQIIQKNTELRKRVEELEKSELSFKEKSEQLELSLLRETERHQALTQEKEAMKVSVEHLLNSIKSLEDAR